MEEPTTRQIQYIRALLQRFTNDDDEIENRINDLETKQEASDLISELRSDLGE